MGGFKIFGGTGSHRLAADIADDLRVPLGERAITRFPDGETSVRIEEAVRNCDVFFVQSTSPPVNERFVEHLVFADACRRASARRITAVVPYFGYARSDKRCQAGEPIAASMAANALEAVGIEHVITVDLHAPQIEGFFHVPVDSLQSTPLLCHAIEADLPAESVVVSPDAGRVRTATDFAKRFRLPVAVLHKERKSGEETAVARVVGDVRERHCLVIDDMISTGGTLLEAVRALCEAGAQEAMTIAVTHGLFLDGAREKLAGCKLRAFWVTDTIEPPEPGDLPLRVAPVAPLIAQAIRRLVDEGPDSA